MIRYDLAGMQVGAFGFFRQGVDPTMHVGVGFPIMLRDGVDDGIGFLGGGGVVEEGEGFAPETSFQNGEVAADSLRIERSGHGVETVRSKTTSGVDGFTGGLVFGCVTRIR